MVEKTAHRGLGYLGPEYAAPEIDWFQSRYLNKRRLFILDSSVFMRKNLPSSGCYVICCISSRVFDTWSKYFDPSYIII